MKNEKIFDLIAWAFIFCAGLFAAYVTFGILQSQASGKFEGYSVGGSIAGALISWSLLTTLYLQIRGSSNELRDLRNRAEELQHKLIRGAPRPLGFEIEVDERQRIVLARPKEWQPKGGTIFDLELSDYKLKAGDSFAAAFRCYFIPIEDKRTPQRDIFYQNESELFNDPDYVHSYSQEMIQLGGEIAGVECLKIIARQFVRITEKRPKDTDRTDRSWYIIAKQEAVGVLDNINPPKLIEGQLGNLELKGYGFRQGAVAYVNEIKRDIRVLDSTTAYLILQTSDTDFSDYQRRLSISIENPEFGGIKTNSITVIVEAKTAEAGIADTGIVIPEPRSEKDAKSETSIETDKIIFQEILRMRVVCYNQQLGKIYYFDFLDDTKDFKDSSAIFNRVLNSVRFLD